MLRNTLSIPVTVLGLLTLLLVVCDDQDPWYDDEVPRRARKYTNMYVSEDNTYRVYQGVCLHNDRMMAIVPTDHESNLTDASSNTAMIELPVDSAKKFFANLNTAFLPGNTLVIDFAFPAFPDNMGHWAEAVLPMFSLFQTDDWHSHVTGMGAAAKTIDTVLLINMDDSELSSWFMEVLRIALEPVTQGNGPEIIDRHDVGDINQTKWLVIENYISVTDRYNHEAGFTALKESKALGGVESGKEIVDQWRYGFQKPKHATLFRQAVYSKVGIPPVPSHHSSGIPKVITFVTAASGENIVNKYEVTDMLWEVAATYGWKVRPFTITNTAPFSSHVDTMASTGILVSRHGPVVTDALFMRPGAIVYELLPFNWEWRQISELYRNMTRSMGDMHHFAWRPTESKWAEYADLNDQRYETWKARECVSRGCMLTHAKAGLKVDVETVRDDLLAIMESLLTPSTESSCSTVSCRVSELERPWPTI